MADTGEEAVIAKSAHVVDDVVTQKHVVNSVKTVRDILRRDEVESVGPTTVAAETTTKRLGI